MKVVGYVIITKTCYVSVYRKGIVAESGDAYAVQKCDKFPKIGDEVKRQNVFFLHTVDQYVPETKLAKILYDVS